MGSAADTPSAELPRQLHVHPTEFALHEDTPHIQDVFRALAHDEARNWMIADNLASLARGGRRILVLSQRKDHLDKLGALLAAEGLDPLLLVGGQTRNHSRTVIDELTEGVQGGGGVIALTTGSYLGEGFDLKRRLVRGAPVVTGSGSERDNDRTVKSSMGRGLARFVDLDDVA